MNKMNTNFRNRRNWWIVKSNKNKIINCVQRTALVQVIYWRIVFTARQNIVERLLNRFYCTLMTLHVRPNTLAAVKFGNKIQRKQDEKTINHFSPTFCQFSQPMNSHINHSVAFSLPEGFSYFANVASPINSQRLNFTFPFIYSPVTGLIQYYAILCPHIWSEQTKTSIFQSLWVTKFLSDLHYFLCSNIFETKNALA